MVTAANSYGSGFVPAPGQIIGVLSGDGIGALTFQDTVIELTVPPYYDRGDLPSPHYPTLDVSAAQPPDRAGPVSWDNAWTPNPTASRTVRPWEMTRLSTAPSYGLCTSTEDEDGVTRVAGKGGASNGGGWTNGTVTGGGGGAVQVTITGGRRAWARCSTSR